ncbi:hypothetical protein M1523_03720 [Patescibacteria group bacterium]|nr:hypothetical protein [Patescibacteria group bacterium]MCL5091802.1 hypothetical protein [Patescibacteria group bacterium]
MILEKPPLTVSHPSTQDFRASRPMTPNELIQEALLRTTDITVRRSRTELGWNEQEILQEIARQRQRITERTFADVDAALAKQNGNPLAVVNMICNSLRNGNADVAETLRQQYNQIGCSVPVLPITMLTRQGPEGGAPMARETASGNGHDGHNGHRDVGLAAQAASHLLGKGAATVPDADRDNEYQYRGGENPAEGSPLTDDEVNAKLEIYYKNPPPVFHGALVISDPQTWSKTNAPTSLENADISPPTDLDPKKAGFYGKTPLYLANGDDDGRLRRPAFAWILAGLTPDFSGAGRSFSAACRGVYNRFEPGLSRQREWQLAEGQEIGLVPPTRTLRSTLSKIWQLIAPGCNQTVIGAVRSTRSRGYGVERPPTNP